MKCIGGSGGGEMAHGEERGDAACERRCNSSCHRGSEGGEWSGRGFFAIRVFHYFFWELVGSAEPSPIYSDCCGN